MTQKIWSLLGHFGFAIDNSEIPYLYNEYHRFCQKYAIEQRVATATTYDTRLICK